jgi:flagellar biosynthesis/type III secretory pathway M-ring protein FliF/YscJ
MDNFEERMKEREDREKERELTKIIERKQIFKIIAYLASIAFLTVILLIGFGPIYAVWSQRLAGEAELAKAESSRKIRILEARAEQEAAKSLAEAEVIRAEGVSKANKIIGDSLQNNEGYLRYLWIQGLQSNHMQVVYVPTEANLPILEATRMNNLPKIEK